MKDILCLYYTRTGTTKALMETIAARLDAELVEYTDGKDRSGVLGYLGCCVASYSKKLPKVRKIVTQRPLSDYSHVIIAMPIWAEGACAVGRGLLEQYRDELPQSVHFVITHMAANDYEGAIQKLDGLLNAPHASHLSVSTKKGDLSAEVEQFVAKIQ